MNNNIIIEDWAGNILYEGYYGSEEVDQTLDANRCNCEDECSLCGGTGYKGDFSVYWEDKDRNDNVYEFINY